MVINVSELCMWYEFVNRFNGRFCNSYNILRIVGGSLGEDQRDYNIYSLGEDKRDYNLYSLESLEDERDNNLYS